MINTNIQINPRVTGVDFSQLLKFSTGGNIPKYAEPAQVLDTRPQIGNMKVNNLSEDQYWTAYNPDILARWKEILASNPNITIDEINTFLRRNPQMVKQLGYTGTGKALRGSDVKQYQQDYHGSLWGFGNSDAFWQFAHAYDHDPSVVTDRRAINGQAFAGDDYLGEQTAHRLSNFFNAPELTKANALVADRNWEWVLDAENANDYRNTNNHGRKLYVLQLKGAVNTAPDYVDRPASENLNIGNESNPNKLVNNDTPKTSVNSDQNGDYEWKALSFQKPEATPLYQPNPFTEPIVNGLALGTSLMNNRRLYNQGIQKRFTLKEGPYQNAKVTNNYFGATEGNQALANAEFKSTLNLGSDLSRNNALRQNAAFNRAEKQIGITDSRVQEYNTTAQNVNKVANQNRLVGVETANYNRTANDAAMNNILAERQKLFQRNATAILDNMDKNHVAWQQYLQNERHEAAAFLDKLNQYRFNLDLINAYADYRNLAKGIGNDSSVLTSVANDWNQAAAMGKLTQDLVATYNNWMGESDVTKKNQYLIDYLNLNSSTDAGKKYWDQYRRNLEAAAAKGADIGVQAQNQYAYTKIYQPLSFSGQGWRIGSNIPTYKSITQPTAKFAKGGRFIDYVKHNRQTLEDALKRELRNAQERNKLLKRDLDALDKETLMLLRSVFGQ